MRVLFHSQPSHAKRENQDHIEVRRRNGARLVALADGQGGQSGGAKAARIAIQAALDFLENAPDLFDSDTLRTAISLADEAVEADGDAGFSTLIVLVCNEHKVAGASVGDSMVWHINSRSEEELTHKQRKNPPLGSGACLGTPFTVEPKRGEQILVMSDGVFRWVEPETIARTCRESSDFEVMRRLLELQKRNEHGDLPDDWSAILIRS